MFSQLKLKIANYLLDRSIKDRSVQKKIVTLSEAKKIGVLFDAKSSNDIAELKILLKFFLHKNIDVSILGFVNKSYMESYHLSSIHIDYFNIKDLTIFGFPNSKKTTSFMNQKFDIVINLSVEDSFATRCLTLKSNTRFKIGMLLDKSVLVYDFMLKPKIKSLNYLIKNLIYYLELIDKNNAK